MALKKKVLIIDDDLDTCRQIKYALQDVTTDAYYALSVAEGIRRLHKALALLSDEERELIGHIQQHGYVSSSA